MTIRPVLVPDHDAAALRKLMDSFSEAATAPVKKKLTESADQGVAEATMSRAAKGYEKYGKEGMAALAAAGREGRALDPVRDRYNRYDEGDVDEGLKSKLAGAALAGAAALGGGGAQAQTTDRFDPAWGTSGYNTSIRSNVSSTKSMNAADPSKDVDDFQKRIQTVTGPNAKGEYKVVVIQGNDIVSHYVTKTPPPGWMAKEGMAESIDPIEQLRADIKRFAQ